MTRQRRNDDVSSNHEQSKIDTPMVVTLPAEAKFLLARPLDGIHSFSIHDSYIPYPIPTARRPSQWKSVSAVQSALPQSGLLSSGVDQTARNRRTAQRLPLTNGGQPSGIDGTRTAAARCCNHTSSKITQSVVNWRTTLKRSR